MPLCCTIYNHSTFSELFQHDNKTNEFNMNSYFFSSSSFYAHTKLLRTKNKTKKLSKYTQILHSAQKSPFCYLLSKYWHTFFR